MSNPLRIVMPRLVALTALLALPFATNAQSSLDKTLAAMDKASAQFHSMQSDIERDAVQPPITDPDIQLGTFYCQRVSHDTVEVGIHFKTMNGRPGEQIILYKNGIGHMYAPGTKQDDQAKGAGFESFLALGCGGSGKDLAKGWNITDQGPEMLTLKDGQKVPTEKLDLISKDEKARNIASHITEWIDLGRGIALQQIIFQPSKDKTTSYYSKVRYNESVDTKPFEIPKNAKVMMH